jgi:hypothetical protein
MSAIAAFLLLRRSSLKGAASLAGLEIPAAGGEASPVASDEEVEREASPLLAQGVLQLPEPDGLFQSLMLNNQ